MLYNLAIFFTDGWDTPRTLVPNVYVEGDEDGTWYKGYTTMMFKLSTVLYEVSSCIYLCKLRLESSRH